MALSTRKITYTSEFKLKVLDYYFKNGGDDNFGLKKKTASHFNIDKKTINRMLKNTDMVKRAQKLLAKRLASASARAQAKTTPPTPEKASTSSSSSKTAKATTSKAGTSGAGGSTKGTGKSTAGSNSKNSSQSKNSVGPGGSRASASSSSSSTNKTTASTKQSGGGGGSQATSRTKNVNHGTANKKSVPVFELPEDPDYSVLKPSIAASTNSVAMIAKALISGTPEVRNVLLNECEMILECKVCRNLFRSLVNFLAHKRIYCQDEYAGVRSLFHKDPVQGLTSQSHTLIVEPELPPDYYTPGPLPPGASDHQGRGGRGGIDSIAERLAGNRQTLSHPTHTGSSQYHGILDGISRTRDHMSRECTVVLEDIAGVTTARYQTFAPPIPTPTTTVPMSALLDQVAHHSAGITLALDENGDIVETARGDVHTMSIPPSNATYSSQDLVCDNCNTRFASHKTLSVHMRTQHQFQRFVYVCPICRSSFYNMFSVTKHLQHAHKKTKHQLERLRKVIKKNVRRKTFFVNKDGKEEEREDEQIEEEEEEEDEDEETEKMEVGSPSKSPQKSSPQKSPQKASPNPRRPSPSKASSSKGTGRDSSPDHRCTKCDRRCSTMAALISHEKFCSLLQMKPDMPPECPLSTRMRSETPEKKIAIQIRKDYRKTMTSDCPKNMANSVCQDQDFKFKVPEVPDGENPDPEILNDEEAIKKLESLMSQVPVRLEALMDVCCILKPILKCIPCDKMYTSLSSLKRHMVQHFNITRYQCHLCHVRDYFRYEIMHHCVKSHKISATDAELNIIQETKLGPLKYYLYSDEENSVDSQETNGDDKVQEQPTRLSKSVDSTIIDVPDEEKDDKSKITLIDMTTNSKSSTKDNAIDNKEEESDKLCLIKCEDVKGNGSNGVIYDDELPDINIDCGNIASQVSEGKGKRSTRAERAKLNQANSSTDPPVVSDPEPTTPVAMSPVKTKDCDLPPIILTSESGRTYEVVKQYPLRGYIDASLTKNLNEDLDEGIWEEPQRIRRSTEHKDFLYDKASSVQALEVDNIPLAKTKQNFDSPERAKRKSSSQKVDSPAKKIKRENIAYESCNGRSHAGSPSMRSSPLTTAKSDLSQNTTKEKRLTKSLSVGKSRSTPTSQNGSRQSLDRKLSSSENMESSDCLPDNIPPTENDSSKKNGHSVFEGNANTEKEHKTKLVRNKGRKFSKTQVTDKRKESSPKNVTKKLRESKRELSSEREASSETDERPKTKSKKIEKLKSRVASSEENYPKTKTRSKETEGEDSINKKETSTEREPHQEKDKPKAKSAVRVRETGDKLANVEVISDIEDSPRTMRNREREDKTASSERDIRDSPRTMRNRERDDKPASSERDIGDSPRTMRNREREDKIASSERDIEDSPRTMRNQEREDKTPSSERDLGDSPRTMRNREREDKTTSSERDAEDNSSRTMKSREKEDKPASSEGDLEDSPRTMRNREREKAASSERDASREKEERLKTKALRVREREERAASRESSREREEDSPGRRRNRDDTVIKSTGNEKTDEKTADKLTTSTNSEKEEEKMKTNALKVVDREEGSPTSRRTKERDDKLITNTTDDKEDDKLKTKAFKVREREERVASRDSSTERDETNPRTKSRRSRENDSRENDSRASEHEPASKSTIGRDKEEQIKKSLMMKLVTEVEEKLTDLEKDENGDPLPHEDQMDV